MDGGEWIDEWVDRWALWMGEWGMGDWWVDGGWVGDWMGGMGERLSQRLLLGRPVPGGLPEAVGRWQAGRTGLRSVRGTRPTMIP